MKYLLLLLLISLNSSLFAQNKLSNSLPTDFNSSIKIDPNICVYSNNQNIVDKQVQELISSILSRFGAKNRYVVLNCSNIENCQATIYDGIPYILYNPKFIGTISKLNFSSSTIPITNNDWATLTYFAHEIAHHLNNHLTNPLPQASISDLEKEADETAGFIMSMMGCEINKALLAFESCPENGSYTHPPRIERINSFKTGFNKANEKKRNNPGGDIVFENKTMVPLRTSSGNYTFAKFGSTERLFNKEFDYVRRFVNGYSAVKLNGLWGFINQKGEYLIKPKYLKVTDFNSKGVAKVFYTDDDPFKKENKIHTIINTKGIEILPYGEYGDLGDGNLIAFKKGELWGYMDFNGIEKIAPKKGFGNTFYEGMCSVRGISTIKGASKIGFMDSTGKLVIPYLYTEDEWGFHEGLAGVYNDEGLGGYIDKSGNIKIPLKYEDINTFTDGLVEVAINDREILIDKFGKEYIPLKKYDALYTSSSKLVRCQIGGYETGKFGFLDRLGDEIIAPLYESGTKDFSENKCFVVRNGKGGFIDEKGNVIISFKYETKVPDNLFKILEKQAMSFSDGITAVLKKDFSGKIIIIYVDENGLEYQE
jgi:hypothetical protein